MKRLLCILLAVLAMGQARAQEEYISNSRDAASDQFADLEGRKGVLVLSAHSSLILRVTNASLPVEEVRPGGKRPDGLYEYKLILAADDTREAKVEVSRMGDVYTTEFIATLKPDFLVAYRIEEIEQPIRYEDQTRGNDARLNAAEAELEISTTIKGLTVKCSDKLGATVTSAPSKADPNVSVISVVLPVATLQAARDEAGAARKEYARLTALIETDKATDADFDSHDAAEARLERAEAALRELTAVDIYSDKTNHLAIDISSLGPRSKKSYVVLPVVIEKEVFVTEFSARMNDGGRLFAQRNYADARAAFVEAIEAKDAPLSMKPAVMASIQRCDTCMRYERLATAALSELVKMKKAGTGTQDDVYRYASAGIYFLGVVNNNNASDFYASRIAKLEELIKKQPLNVGFTVVEWLTLSEGNPLPAVELWAYYGAEPPSPVVYNTPRRFRRAIKAEADKYVQVGMTDAQGRVEIELDRAKLPTAFVFCPSTDESVKITSLPFADFVRRASGDYHMKQLRVKMYKRTNKHF